MGVALNSRGVGELALCGPSACTVKGRLAEPARAIDAGLPDSIRALRQEDEADAGDALS